MWLICHKYRLPCSLFPFFSHHSLYLCHCSCSLFSVLQAALHEAHLSQVWSAIQSFHILFCIVPSNCVTVAFQAGELFTCMACCLFLLDGRSPSLLP